MPFKILAAGLNLNIAFSPHQNAAVNNPLPAFGSVDFIFENRKTYQAVSSVDYEEPSLSLRMYFTDDALEASSDSSLTALRFFNGAGQHLQFFQGSTTLTPRLPHGAFSPYFTFDLRPGETTELSFNLLDELGSPVFSSPCTINLEAFQGEALLLYAMLSARPSANPTEIELWMIDPLGRSMPLCSNISALADASLVGSPTVTIFPNPVQNQLNFELAPQVAPSESLQLSISNALGQPLLQRSMLASELSNKNFSLPLPSWPAGNYILRILRPGAKPFSTKFFAAPLDINTALRP
ncbi:MAG: T9SS type A sorting domain-containing protein [Lewinella sp.]|nr:T9SS type A sorting domain-containing protein [Lewinella sp.]